MNTHNLDLPSHVMWCDPSGSRRYQIKQENDIDIASYGGNENLGEVVLVERRFKTIDTNGTVMVSPPVLTTKPVVAALPGMMNIKQELRTEGYNNPQQVAMQPNNVEETTNHPQLMYNGQQTTAIEVDYHNASRNSSSIQTAATQLAQSNTPSNTQLTSNSSTDNETKLPGSNTTGVNSDRDATTSFHDIFQMAQSDLHRTMPSTSVAPVVPWRTASRSSPVVPPHGSPFNPLQAYYQNALMNMQPSTSYQQHQFCQGGIFQGQQAFLQSQQQQPQLNNYQQAHIPQLMNYAKVQRTGTAVPRETQDASSGRINNPEKTAFTYDNLIFLALLSAPAKRLMVSEMYPFVMNYFYCFEKMGSWKNSFRHTLNAKTQCFIKDGQCGNSFYYKLNPDKIEEMHISIRKVVDKFEDKLELLRLRNINDLSNLLNGSAPFHSETLFIMRNNQRKVASKSNKTQVHVSPYMRNGNAPETYAQRLSNQGRKVDTNVMHQIPISMTQYNTELHEQQVNKDQMQLGEASGFFPESTNSVADTASGSGVIYTDHLPMQAMASQELERLEEETLPLINIQQYGGFVDILRPLLETNPLMEDIGDEEDEEYNEYANELFRELSFQ